MRNLKSAREVVVALGGIDAVCDLTGAYPKAVYYWTGQAHKFPARFYLKMQTALERIECKAPPWLWGQIGYERKDAA